MAVVTIRPDSDYPADYGSWIRMTPSSGTTHYILVNEVSPNDTDYVYNLFIVGYDWFTLSSVGSIPSGFITNVRVVVRAKASDNTAGISASIGIQPVAGDASSYSIATYQAPTTSYANYNFDWAQNPINSRSWTWSDIEKLVVSPNTSTGPVTTAYISQVYVEITYSGTPATGSVMFQCDTTHHGGQYNYNTTASSYASIHDATAASYTYNATWTQYIGQTYSATGGLGYWVQRGWTLFDTSYLDGAIANAVTAQWAPNSNWYGIYIINPTSTVFSLVIQNGQPTYPHDPVVDADFNYTYYSGTAASVNVTAMTRGVYSNFVFNSSTVNWVNERGTTKLIWRTSRDISSTAPVPSGAADIEERVIVGNLIPNLYVDYQTSLPTVTTQAVTGISNSSALGNFTILSLGGPSVYTSNGVCYMVGTTGDPTVANNNAWATDTTTTGAKTVNITGLAAGTSYRVRALASHDIVTYAYGATVSFTTLNIVAPTITITRPVAHLSSTGVSVTGNITNLGGASATTRGFCYATATTPTTASMTAGATSAGFSAGTYTYNITGISASTLYHTRAFAINSAGVGYSTDEVHFDVETQSSKIGIKTLSPSKLMGKKLNTKVGLKSAILNNLSFTRKISTKVGIALIRQAVEVIKRTLSTLVGLTPVLGTRKITSKLATLIGLKILTPTKAMSKSLSTKLGLTPTKFSKLAVYLNTKIGLISSSSRKLGTFLNTKFGLISSLIKNAEVKRSLSASAALYTQGFWSGYNYCKTVTITPSIDGALTNYPMKLTIHRTTGTDSTSDVYIGTECAVDYSDIYFDIATGEALYYWVESPYTDSQASVWIKIPTIPASPATMLRFYYGSSLSSIRNSGDTTFTFFDDFSTGLSKWTTDNGCSIVGEELVVQSTSTATKTAYSNTSFGTNYAMRARLKSAHINASSNVIEDVSISATEDGHGVGVSYSSYYSAYNNTYYNFNIDNGRTYLPVSGWSVDAYHTQDILRNGSTDSRFYVDNLNYVSVTGVDTDSHPIRFFTVNNTAKLTVDWVVIRPYTVNEPLFGAWSSKATIIGSPFKTYVLKLFRTAQTKIGSIGSYYRYKGFFDTFSLVIGLTGNLSYFKAFSFSTVLGLTALFDKNKQFNRTLQKPLGVVASISKNNFRILTTLFGVLAETFVFGRGKARFLETVLGIKSSYINNIGLYRTLISKIGLTTSSFKRSLSKQLKTGLGIVSTKITSKGHIKVFSNSIGLVGAYSRRMVTFLTTKFGMVASLSKTISVSYIMRTGLGILTRPISKRFETVLSALIGISSGFISQLFIQRNFFNYIGMLARVATDKSRVYEFILTTSIGLVGTKIVRTVVVFSTSLKLAPSIIWTRGLKFSTSLGIKATKLSYTLFGLKRFKSLKFLDPKTSDNKKLRIKK